MPCTLAQFGAMMSATDPVATIAVLNEVGAPRQLRTLIEGESLVNDGTAYVLFFLLRVRAAPLPLSLFIVTCTCSHCNRAIY